VCSSDLDYPVFFFISFVWRNAMTGRCHLPAGVIALALAVVLGECGLAKADIISDPVGDFLPTFKGARDGAFDVISAGGTFDGSFFHLFGKLAGPVSGAPPGSIPLYVWGINTGTGPNNFANIGNPNVRFNNVFTLNAAGVTNNANVKGRIEGDMVFLDVPLSAVPSTGFAPQNYLWNLWPRDTSPAPDPAPIGNANAIADFAPDNAVAAFTTIPEPSTLVLFAGMLGALGVVRRWRKSAAA